MDRPKAAVELFNSGCNCSQAVLAIFGEGFGLDRKTALKLASGFGGGIGGSGSVCGALTGACMAMGLALGPSVPGDADGKAAIYRKVRILSEEFKMRTGSTICRELLGFDLGTPEGRTAAQQSRAFDKCDEFVRTAAEILDEMLQ